MTRYKNLLVGGCSFSQDGIGGSPPTETQPGGCSFIEDIEYEVASPNSWAGFLAQKLGVTSLVNTAASSHGNILTANSILECINKFQYNCSDTLVVVNITEPTRLDIPCYYDHPDADNEFIPWSQTLIPYSFFKRNSNTIVALEKNMGFDQIEYFTSNAVDLLLNFLENKGFDFYFLTMADFSNSCLQTVLNKFQDRHIKLNPGLNMIDYCKITNNQKSKKDEHPSLVGHKQIADQIYSVIENDLYLPVL